MEKNASRVSLKRTSFTNLEVDPNKMKSEDDENINRLALQLICQKIFVRIFRSIDSFPM